MLVTSHILAEEIETSSDVDNRLMVTKGRRGGESQEFGISTPLHYSCLENPMDGGAWWAAVHGEGNGNPLWCSCLENPREGGAWWAAWWVAQSRTRLKVTQQQQHGLPSG